MDGELEEIKRLRELMFTPKEIELAMGVKGIAALIVKTGTPEWEAAQSGWLAQVAKQRKVIFDLAERGSSPAQQMVIKLIHDDRVKQAAGMAE